MANKETIANLQDLIKDTIGGEVVAQTVESLLPPGENYGSVMYKVDFKVRKNGKEEQFYAVAKCTPPNAFTQEVFHTQETFKTEIAWYTTVIPTLKQFQRDHGVEREIDFFQNFYGARISLDPTSTTVDLDGVILSQNLKHLGYHNEDRHVGFDLPTTYTILRDLATFHAVPLALKIKDAELFNKNINSHLPVFNDQESLRQSLNSNIFTVFEYIPESQQVMERIRKSMSEVIVFGARPLREPWVTVIHKDFWINNIMVTGGKDSKTMILDLQIPLLGSPAADLIFFLFTSIKIDVIRENFDIFLKFYFEEFLKNLKELNIPTEQYTFEGLIKEIETEVKLGEFSHCLSHSVAILAEKGAAIFDSSDEHFKTEDLENHKVHVNERQIEKFRWILSEVVKRKWI